MDWNMIKTWAQGLVTAEAKDWTFGALEAGQVPAGLDQIPAQPVIPESGYLSLFVRSMRIVDVRKLTTTFYAVVHTFTALDYLSGTKAQFHVLTTPGDLQELDPGNIDDVISFNRRMLGPIPYRGGDLDLNLALLSVKSGDLAAPYIELLHTVSKQAGFTFGTTEPRHRSAHRHAERFDLASRRVDHVQPAHDRLLRGHARAKSHDRSHDTSP